MPTNEREGRWAQPTLREERMKITFLGAAGEVTGSQHLIETGKLRVLLDCANGAAYQVAPTAIWELGAKVFAVGVTPNGTNINDKVGSTALETVIDLPSLPLTDTLTDERWAELTPPHDQSVRLDEW